MKKKISHFIAVFVFINTAYGGGLGGGGWGPHLPAATEEATKALEELQGGRADEARMALKNARQYTKEMTGEVASIKLQKANQAIKETIRILDEEKDNKKAIEVLTPAVQSMKEINVEAKTR